MFQPNVAIVGKTAGTERFTLGHEIGHLFGCEHNKEELPQGYTPFRDYGLGNLFGEINPLTIGILISRFNYVNSRNVFHQIMAPTSPPQ